MPAGFFLGVAPWSADTALLFCTRVALCRLDGVRSEILPTGTPFDLWRNGTGPTAYSEETALRVRRELTKESISGSERIPSLIDGGGNKWWGGVTVDGIVYGIPCTSNYVLIYDPSSNKVSGSEQIPSSIDGGDW